MIAGNLEYILFRLIRRFLLKGPILDRLAGRLPHYQPSLGEISPAAIVDRYWKFCRMVHFDPVGKTVLEIGTGRTNGTVYEISGRGARGIAYEPYVQLDQKMDRRVFERTAFRHPHLVKDKILRVTQLGDLAGSSVDLALSHSVLEHVRDMDRLLLDLKRVLTAGACMIHIVDYRDHFFKYPFHFLQFSTPVWYRYLNPGDLSRARIGDHLRVLQRHRFRVQVLAREQDLAAFSRIQKRIHDEFRYCSPEDLATTVAVLFVEKS